MIVREITILQLDFDGQSKLQFDIGVAYFQLSKKIYRVVSPNWARCFNLRKY